MKRISVMILLISLFSTLLNKWSLAKNADDPVLRLENPKAELEDINKRIEIFYSKESFDSLAELFAKEFIFMPEYKSAIAEIKTLKAFYRDWFNTVEIINFKKNIYKVEVYGDYILEIGNFSLIYSTQANQKNDYTGKYMAMWKHDANKRLRILSEAFGSDKYIEAKNVPYARVEVKNSFVLNTNMVSDKVSKEIEEIDKTLTKAVTEGNGKARADGFMKDGIYMPHFGEILEGMDTLLPYMLKTYNPDAKLYVRNTYQEIFDLGEFVFLSGHFKGGWGDTISGGKFEGNMSNLFKRNEDGDLKMYRQLANNDR